MLLRLMTYNILDGGTGREQFLLNAIKEAQPDIVMLQEVGSPALLDYLSRQLQMYSSFAQANRHLAWGESLFRLKLARRNIGLLSRFPIFSSASYSNFPVWNTLLEAEIEYAPAKRLFLMGVHLMPNLALPFELWRWLEVQNILRHMRSKPTDFFILSGDFNTINRGDRVLKEQFPPKLKLIVALQCGKVYRLALPKLLDAKLTDCYRTLHPEIDGFTLPPPEPNARLDYIFASPNLAPTLRSCEVLTTSNTQQASDHFPVIAEFEI